MEARGKRVRQALHILAGHEVPLDEDEEAMVNEYRKLCVFGYGRMEVVVVAHRMEGANLTKHMKRKDLIFPPQKT